jgi:cytochrome b561
MALRSNDERWGSIARLFHWVMAIAILTMGLVGHFMADMAVSPQKVKIYAIHKSIGLTLLALALLRLSWRAIDRRPREVPMPRWQAAAARVSHAFLYLLMLAIPLSGWVFNSAAGFPLRWFSLVRVPSLTGGADPDLKALAHTAHEGLFYVLLAVVALHAAAAVMHHVVDRDDTLRRMVPWLRRRTAVEPGPDAAPVAPEPPSLQETPR